MTQSEYVLVRDIISLPFVWFLPFFWSCNPSNLATRNIYAYYIIVNNTDRQFGLESLSLKFGNVGM